MNKDDGKVSDTYRSFLLLSEIDKDEALSQRELAVRLGIALGLVNSYLKNLVAKGFVRVRNFPGNRYGYLLTPSGVTEKSRLAYHHLRYFTNLYTIARQDFADLFLSLKASGVTGVVFCGVDEVAEIAYLSLKGTGGIDLVAVLDDDRAGEPFFDRVVAPLAEIDAWRTSSLVLTTFKKQAKLRQRLRELGVGPAELRSVGVPESGDDAETVPFPVVQGR